MAVVRFISHVSVLSGRGTAHVLCMLWFGFVFWCVTLNCVHDAYWDHKDPHLLISNSGTNGGPEQSHIHVPFGSLSLVARTHSFHTLFTTGDFFSAPTIAPAPAVSTVRTGNIIIPQTQNVTAESVTCGLIASRIWMCLQCIALPLIMRNSHFTSWLNDTVVN